MANRVRRTFGDDAGVQIIDDDIFRWINDAQLQISVDNEELLETVATSDIVAGQADYTTPSNMNTLRSLMYNNLRLRSLSFAEFNEYIDGFRNPAGSPNSYGNGTPEVFMVYGGVITLFPTPDTSLVGGLRIYYAKHPPSVGNLADGLGVPDRYHNSVVEYCLKMAYEMDENFDAANYKKGEFENQIMKLKNQEKTTSTEYYPRITVLPEDSTYDEGGWLYG
ncbi:phage adaptor protein [Streptomyces griseosporeus]|uniref:phage adaptor protein n=1 Tax=Streptomyces griseosporeus TaxID=1910 RepID=UPI00167EC2E0|nr:DUF6682 family protein [Streptomyces griseosporeus]